MSLLDKLFGERSLDERGYDYLRAAELELQMQQSSPAKPKQPRADAKVIAALEGRVDRAELVIAALSRILEDKLQVSEDEIAEAIVAADLEDGHADGKVGTHACSKCSRTNRSGKSHCVFCGAALG